MRYKIKNSGLPLTFTVKLKIQCILLLTHPCDLYSIVSELVSDQTTPTTLNTLTATLLLLLLLNDNDTTAITIPHFNINCSSRRRRSRRRLESFHCSPITLDC